MPAHDSSSSSRYSEDVASADVGERKRRRNRTTQSCLNCHTSKRKCDRRRPCSRCIQLGLTGLCVYEVDDPSMRSDPTSDETTRMRNRIAELESLVRELRGKPHPKWADSPVQEDRGEKWHSRASKKRKTRHDPDPDHDYSEREMSDDGTPSTEGTVSGDSQPNAVSSPVKTEPETPEFRRAPVATSGGRSVTHSYPLPQSSSSSSVPYASPYTSPISPSVSFSSSTPMELYTDMRTATYSQTQSSYVAPTATPAGACYASSIPASTYPNLIAFNDHAHEHHDLRCSTDRNGELAPYMHPQGYDRLPSSVSCNCQTFFGSMFTLIRLQQKLQETVEEMRALPPHARHGQSALEDRCQILTRLEDLNDFLHGRNLVSESQLAGDDEWSYPSQPAPEVVPASSYRAVEPDVQHQHQTFHVGASSWPAEPCSTVGQTYYVHNPAAYYQQ